MVDIIITRKMFNEEKDFERICERLGIDSCAEYAMIEAVSYATHQSTLEPQTERR